MHKRYLIALLCLLPFSSGASPLFQYSTDQRLMSDIVKLGRLENGMVVYQWLWTQSARERMSLTAIVGTKPTDFGVGLIAQEVQKDFPEAVMTDQDGYLRIDSEILARQDQFIRWKLTSTGRNRQGRCAEILETQLIICF